MKIFISHSSKDKRFVRKLKNCLLENSIQTWFDEDQLDFGDSLVSKLETALEGSSHLVIVLSPFSVDSEWVKFELNKALKNTRTGLMNKVIPIKYKNCDVPNELSDLLYADLSDEVVLPEGNEVKFISNGFDPFFLKLVRALRNSSKSISADEKNEIMRSIKSSETEIIKRKKSIHRGNYQLNGYTSLESRQKYQKVIASAANSEVSFEDLRPFLLPPSAKKILSPNIGEEIIFEDHGFLESYGHFAGFRNDDLNFTADRRTRDELHVKSQKYYQIEIDGESRKIKFINKII